MDDERLRTRRRRRVTADRRAWCRARVASPALELDRRLFGELPGLRFCEVIAESLSGRRSVPEPLAELVARGVTVIPHGVRLSLGGTDPVDPGRVSFLAGCAERLRAPLVSDHVAFVRAGGVEAGHLLPVPRTCEALDVLVHNITTTQAALTVPLALEPIAALFDWPDDEMTKADLLNALLDYTGTLLLLDVANVYANARNRGQDPLALLERLPLDRIGYLHVAGGAEHDGLYHDTHTDPTPPEVLDLVRRSCWNATAATRPRPSCTPNLTRSPTPPASRGSRTSLGCRGSPKPPGRDGLQTQPRPGLDG